MFKKLTLLAMAVAAFAALVVPALASAADETKLTMPEGTLVPVTTKILATSTNTETTTSLGTLKCPTVTLTGEVTENSGKTVAGIGSGSTTGQCKVKKPSGVEENITIEEIKLSELMSTGTVTAGIGTADVAFSFKAILPTVTCTFKTKAKNEAGEVVTGWPATYANGSNVLTLTKVPLESACGAGALTGTFLLTTDPKAGGEGNVIFDVN